MVNRPGFFKFYLPSLGDENLKIPSRFIQSVQGTWPMNLALRDSYDNLWNVKVEMVGGDWYFKDGWTKFADDNMIKGGDLLVYEYFSQGLLDFKVHDSSACLTEGVGGWKIKNIEEEQIIKIESDDDVVNHTNKTDYVPIYEEEYSHDDYHKVEKVKDAEEENQWDDHFQVDRVRDDAGDDPSVPATEEENQIFDFIEAEEATDGKDQEANKRDAHPIGLDLMNGTAISSKRKIRRDYDWYGVEIFKTRLVPQPRNPYFVTKKRRNRAGELYIPMDVIRCYNLKLPETVMLLDPKGRQFFATRKIWADERTFYFGGWKGLCRVNMVEDEDSCICEFLQNGGDLHISVSFFPPR